MKQIPSRSLATSLRVQNHRLKFSFVVFDADEQDHPAVTSGEPSNLPRENDTLGLLLINQ